MAENTRSSLLLEAVRAIARTKGMVS